MSRDLIRLDSREPALVLHFLNIRGHVTMCNSTVLPRCPGIISSTHSINSRSCELRIDYLIEDERGKKKKNGEQKEQKYLYFEMFYQYAHFMPIVGVGKTGEY